MPVVSLDLLPIAYVYAMLAIAFVVGYIPARWFLGSLTRSEKLDDGPGVFFLAPVLGFLFIQVCVFYATQWLNQGTGVVAPPLVGTLAVIGLVATAIVMWRDRSGFSRQQILPYVPLVIAAPLAAYNVLAPVITGHWQVAYSTGNDATRYLMMVRYLQDSVWHWNDSVGTAYPLWDRPLEHSAGATFAAIFPMSYALADTLAAVTASVLGAGSLCLVFEGLTSPTRWRERYVVAGVAVLAMGLWGVTTEIFYTGYLGQHFSIMAVLASLGFVAVRGNRKLVAWHLVWCVLLALTYSIVLTGLYAATVGVTLVLPTARKEWINRMLWQAPALLIGVALGALVDVGEHVLMTQEFVQSFSETRDPGFAWSPAETVLRFAGLLSRFEALDIFPRRQVIAIEVVIGALMLGSAWLAFRLHRRQPGFTAIWIAVFGLPLVLEVTGHQYFGHKLSLYMGFPLVLACLLGALMLYQSRTRWLRFFGLVPMAAMLGIFFASTRLLGWYWVLVDERYTKVDSVTDTLVRVVHSVPAAAGDNKPVVYAVDYGSERHLLLQELLNDLPWQPISLDYIWEEFRWTQAKHPAWFDDYKYDVMLWAQTYKCEPIDLSGNSPAEIYSHPPFFVYGPRSSTLEPISGLEPAVGPWDDTRSCNTTLMQLQPDAPPKFLLVNNGQHNWLEMTFDCHCTVDEFRNTPLKVTADGADVPLSPPVPGPDPAWSQVSLRLDGLSGRARVNIAMDKGTQAGVVGLSHAAWGY